MVDVVSEFIQCFFRNLSNAFRCSLPVFKWCVFSANF